MSWNAVVVLTDNSTVPPAEIIGHRGAAYDAPENTLVSINLAWQQNADAVEIDVFLTKDGHIVAIHDENTKRLAGVDMPVVAQTLAELRKLDVGSWKDPKFKGERIPTLLAVLETIPDGKRLFIEVKCGPEVVPALEADFAKSGKTADQVVVISFSYDVLTAVKRALPGLKVYWTIELKQDQQSGKWSPPLDELIAQAKAGGLDGLDFGRATIIDKAYVSRVTDEGLGFYMWTINSPDDARRLQAAGVQGLTTDRPGWLREQLSQAVDQR